MAWRDLGLNRTEARQLCVSAGLKWPRRDLSLDELESLFNLMAPTLSKQTVRRKKTQRFVQENWEILKTELTCRGDCSEAENGCSDAQALCCFKINEDLL